MNASSITTHTVDFAGIDKIYVSALFQQLEKTEPAKKFNISF